MIFISHQSNDKEFVAPIAYELESIYGEDTVFYDEWSIKPGENIIDRMNTGLSEMEFFLFFITENSLNSEMVKLEWTSALMDKSKKKIKFIPIRADRVEMPSIIATLKYLDMFTNGLEVTLRQIKEIISPNANQVREYSSTFNNREAYTYQDKAFKINFTIRVKRFYEPSGFITLISTLNQDDIEFISNQQEIILIGYNENIGQSINGESLNAFSLNFPGGLTVGFPKELVLRLINKFKVKSAYFELFHKVADDTLNPINILQVGSRDDIPK